MSASGLHLCLGGGIGDVCGHLEHDVKALLGLRDVVEALGIVRLVHSEDNLLQRLALVQPLLNKRLDGGLLGFRGRHRLDRGLAAGRDLGLGSIGLALPSLGSLLSSRGRGAASAAVIIVNSLHVVPKVPLARETAAHDRSLTALVHAEERLVAMTMQTVGLALVAKEASSGGEPGALTSLGLASVGLQVRVNKLAVTVVSLFRRVADTQKVQFNLLIVALKLLGLVVAVWLALPRAVEESVRLGSNVLVQGMVSGGLPLTSLSASGIGLGKSRGILYVGNGVCMHVLRHHWDLSVSEGIEPVRR